MAQKHDGYGKKVSDCGDTIELFLTVDNGAIKDVVYEIHGCTFTLACAQAVAALARKKSLTDVKEATTPERIDAKLGGLPEHNKHCAELASEAMAEAMRSTVINQREPWRKLYGNR